MTVTTPIPIAESKSSPKSPAGIRRDFDSRPRARFGAVEVRDIGLPLWVAGMLGQRRFVKGLELIAGV